MKNNLNSYFNKKIKNYDLIIIDFFNRFFAYNGVFHSLKDKKGRSTGSFYGFLNLVYSLKIKYGKKVKIIFVLDEKPEKKIKINDTYKANRNRQKYKDHGKEIKELNNLLSLYGVYQYYALGVEADDIAGRLVEKNKEKNILLISNDNDWNFLLDEKVNIFKDNKIYTKELVESIYDIDVKKRNLYKAIIGERKENIFGIKSISHSLINEIVKDCSSLEDIFNYCIVGIGMKSDKAKWLQKIVDNFEKVKENFKLKTMITKGYKIQEIKKRKDIVKLLSILRNYSMSSLVQKIRKEELCNK